MRFGSTIKSSAGVTLLETVLGIAIVGLVAVSIYQTFSALLDIFKASDLQIAVSALANEQMEIVRNISYQYIGTVSGIPAGWIPQNQTLVRAGHTFALTTTIRNIDDPFDGTAGGIPNDTAPADYKLVELAVSCTTCGDNKVFTFTGRAAPKNLESASTNGSLFVQAIDANGQPVSGANVTVINIAINPQINISDVTDTTGFLKIIDVPPSVQSYHIVVSKSGYSSDQTYVPSPQNPNPVKLDATIVQQSVTQASFVIDRVAQINASSLTSTCAAVANTSLTLTGSKLIGIAPDVPKFSQTFSTGLSGSKSITGLEWDSYSANVAHTSYDVEGMIPYLPLNLIPNSMQNFKVIMRQKNPSALLVTIKDAATGLPLSNASATLSDGGSFVDTLITGRGFLRQTDWSGGSGQDLFVNQNQYFAGDGNIEDALPAGVIKLKKVDLTNFAASGFLESSTFDTGSASNFYNLTWQPTSQPPDTGADSVKFQVATATTTAPAVWSFVGPDGTAQSYFTQSNNNFSVIHNGDRYLRYRAYLQTASTTYTPTVSDAAVTFASNCVPPGQVFFDGLANDIYTLTVQLAGYQSYTAQVQVASPWQEVIVTLSP